MNHSQHGEEALIDRYLDAKAVGYACELGAGDGVTGSNTKFLEDLGWNVLCIEPNPYLALRCIKQRNRCISFACGDSDREATFYIRSFGGGEMTAGSSLNPDQAVMDDPRVGSGQTLRDLGAVEFEVTVMVKRLDELLEVQNFHRLDFLSLDTEGTEAEVLRGFTLDRWRPKLVVVESWSPDEPHQTYFEAGGYRRVERLAVNDFYLREVNAP